MPEPIGSILRMAREDAGMSLASLARRTNYTKGYLSNIEHGRKQPTPKVILAYERALGDDVNRRALLSGLAASAVAPLAASEVLRQALTAMLEDELSVDEWHHRVESYGRDYIVLGTNGLLERLMTDLMRLRHHDDPAICQVTAKLITLYGKSLPIYDDAQEASRWYRLATTMADRSEDLPTQVWVRGMSALALAYDVKQLPLARLLAHDALALTETPSPGRLGALIAQAHVAAAYGQKATALHGIEQAEQAFEVTDAPSTESDFSIPEWRYWTLASLLYARLGDEARGSGAQEQACRSMPKGRISRFIVSIDLHQGLMLAKAGDKAGGLSHARTALDRLPSQYHSLSMGLILKEIERA